MNIIIKRVDNNPYTYTVQSNVAYEQVEEYRIVIYANVIWYDLTKDELIHTENSYKFSIFQIESLFEKSGIKINKIWYDSRKYFALVLGQKI